MGEIKNPTIRISDFGPISKAIIEIKPLTIFIGGHNTGKSYAAQLIYCMARTLRSDYRRLGKVERKIGGITKKEYRAVGKELKGLEGLARHGTEVKFGEIGETLRNKGKDWWACCEELCKDEVKSSLNQYFMAEDIGELVRFGGAPVQCEIKFSAIGENDIRLRIRIVKKSGKINVKVVTPDIEQLNIMNAIRKVGTTRIPRGLDYDDFQVALLELWREVWKGIGDYQSYYLPAARSGILQLWGMLQLYALESLPEQMGLPGLVKDFLTEIARSGVFWSGKKRRERVKKALELLEGEILHGKIGYRRERPGPSIIRYAFGDEASLSIQRASSMVAELAPLDLWIERVLDEGDLLIIEEPEAHLHPSSQIQIAKLIARLVNSGIRIICTTHSPLLVSRISNLMLAGKVRESVRRDVGLEAVDIIKEEDLGVYQFVATDNGSLVNRLKMISKFGIPEDEFLEEYEKISFESYKVSS